jgi:recombination protein RecT
MSTPNTQVAKKTERPVDKLTKILSSESVTTQFKNALKENSDVFIASILDMYSGDSGLQQCDPGSVVKEALKAAVLKLPINKALGFAYVIAFNNSYLMENGQWGKRMEPTFQLGYKGYIQLAMRTGQYRIINADVVFEGEFKTKNKLTGEFDISGSAISSTVVGYFAHMELINGFSKTLYMSLEKVTDHAKRYSKSFNAKNTPWKTNFDEMATKTVLRNLLSHYGFLSVEMSSAISNDINNDDTDQKVANEIEAKANKESLVFDEAEVVEEVPQVGTQQMQFEKATAPNF